MSFLKSPGVLVKEIDLTTIVPSVSTSIGAIAGAFEKGPVGSIVTLGTEDDLVACMFMFGWATDQTYFKELTDNDIRMTMMKEQQDALEQDMAPFGFIVNGIDDPFEDEIDEYGTRWTSVVRDYNTNW